MIKSAKRGILLLFDSLGYRVMRARDYERLAARAGQTVPVPALAPEPAPTLTLGPAPAPAAAADATPARMAGAAEPPVVHAPAVPAPFDAAPFSPILQRLLTPWNFSLPRLQALYAAAKYITENEIEGDFVDCGWGDPTTLLALAASLLHLNHTDRLLELFDSSASPLNRAETDLAPWGTEHDLLRKPPARKPPLPEAPPAELLSIGYPAERVTVRRYPREPIAHAAPMALLCITSETYDANREAFDVFYSRLSRGGILAVEDIPGGHKDALAQLLGATAGLLNFTQAAPNVRTAVKP
jgi:hypothetical protein